MKFLLTSDWHLTDRSPQNRIDEYWETQKSKVKFILQKAVSGKVDAILHGGDLFHTTRVSNKVLYETICLLNLTPRLQLLVVPGQHDMFYHSQDLSNSPLSVLEAAGCLTIGNKQNLCRMFDNIDFVGYGQPIPNKGEYLVVHKMIVDEKLWDTQKDYEYGIKLLRTTNYRMILSGDNHQQFVVEYKGKLLVNPGSLMRMTTAQIQHKPAVYIYDDATNSLDRIPIPIKEDVFDMSCVTKSIEKQQELDEFVLGLRNQLDGKSTEVNFVDNIKSAIVRNNIDEITKSIIMEALSGTGKTTRQ